MNIELLAPAGSFEKLKLAFHYGADACYLGGKLFSLRARASNFSDEQLEKTLEYARFFNKRIYVAVNSFMRNSDIPKLTEYIEFLATIGVDALIVADPGVLRIVKKVAPKMSVHISTQANVTNWLAAKQWADLGAERIITAREISLNDIKEMVEKCPEIEVETFVHGAMCVAYSGRCLLSNYMNGRDANRGDCSQSCRYKYHLVEENKDSEYFPVYENEQGTFIMNSKDICMINYMKELIDSGITSFKIEGRMKGSFYIAVTCNSYRKVIDNIIKTKKNSKKLSEKMYKDLEMISHREYDTGFFFHKTNSNKQIYTKSSYIKTKNIIGVISETAKEYFKVQVSNEIKKGMKVNIYSVEGIFENEIVDIIDEFGNSFDSISGDVNVFIKFNDKLPENMKYCIIYKDL